MDFHTHFLALKKKKKKSKHNLSLGFFAISSPAAPLANQQGFKNKLNIHHPPLILSPHFVWQLFPLKKNPKHLRDKNRQLESLEVATD